MPPPRIGTEVAGYRIEAVVGRGATSTVYRAEDPRLRIPIALKVLNAEVAEDDSFRERFVREYRLVASLNHPNIIPLFDAGILDDTLYIAMRYVAGGSLKERLHDGPLPPERVLPTLVQVAGALDVAHAHGLVHRDVKPANVLVDAGLVPHAPDVAYLSDFGLIKNVRSGGLPTPTGALLGTIAYVAPEQIEGRPVDARADVYSLACVAFECLTGRVPFERDNDAATLWAHMQEEPRPASALDPELPRRVDDVLARGLAKRPDDRFTACGELVAALGIALEPRPTPPRRSRRESRPERPPERPPRTQRLRLVALAAAAAALGAGLAAAAFTARPDGEPRPAAISTVTETVRVREERESAVLSAIPELIRSTCSRGPAPSPDFDESFRCRPRRGAAVVSYSHAFSGPLLTEYFDRRVARLGIESPTGAQFVRHFGSCGPPRRLPAVEEWHHVGRAGHQEIGRARFRNADGRILCYVANGKARIEWTTTFVGYYAAAEGKNLSRLLEWWRREAGPLRSD